MKMLRKSETLQCQVTLRCSSLIRPMTCLQALTILKIEWHGSSPSGRSCNCLKKIIFPETGWHLPKTSEFSWKMGGNHTSVIRASSKCLTGHPSSWRIAPRWKAVLHQPKCKSTPGEVVARIVAKKSVYQTCQGKLEFQQKCHKNQTFQQLRTSNLSPSPWPAPLPALRPANLWSCTTERISAEDADLCRWPWRSRWEKRYKVAMWFGSPRTNGKIMGQAWKSIKNPGLPVVQLTLHVSDSDNWEAWLKEAYWVITSQIHLLATRKSRQNHITPRCHLEFPQTSRKCSCNDFKPLSALVLSIFTTDVGVWIIDKWTFQNKGDTVIDNNKNNNTIHNTNKCAASLCQISATTNAGWPNNPAARKRSGMPLTTWDQFHWRPKKVPKHRIKERNQKRYLVDKVRFCSKSLHSLPVSSILQVFNPSRKLYISLLL